MFSQLRKREKYPGRAGETFRKMRKERRGVGSLVLKDRSTGHQRAEETYDLGAELEVILGGDRRVVGGLLT
jgi:hypothetical protein